MWVALRTHPPGPEWIANLISRRIFVNHHCSIIFGLFNFELFRIFSSFILWQILPHLADYFADFPQLHVRVLALDDVPDFSWVPHVWHQRLFQGLYFLTFLSFSPKNLNPIHHFLHRWCDILPNTEKFILSKVLVKLLTYSVIIKGTSGLRLILYW